MNRQGLLAFVERLRPPFLVGISGFGGSGKSTLAAELVRLTNAEIISVDSFFKSTEEESYENWSVIDFDHLYHAVILPLKRKASEIRFLEMNWETGKRDRMRTVPNTGKIIIEGVGLFRAPLMEQFDLSIWIECSLDTAASRGKARDKTLYGKNNDLPWDTIWRRNDLEYFEKESPQNRATIIFNGEAVSRTP